MAEVIDISKLTLQIDLIAKSVQKAQAQQSSVLLKLISEIDKNVTKVFENSKKNLEKQLENSLELNKKSLELSKIFPKTKPSTVIEKVEPTIKKSLTVQATPKLSEVVLPEIKSEKVVPKIEKKLEEKPEIFPTLPKPEIIVPPIIESKKEKVLPIVEPKKIKEDVGASLKFDASKNKSVESESLLKKINDDLIVKQEKMFTKIFGIFFKTKNEVDLEESITTDKETKGGKTVAGKVIKEDLETPKSLLEQGKDAWKEVTGIFKGGKKLAGTIGKGASTAGKSIAGLGSKAAGLGSSAVTGINAIGTAAAGGSASAIAASGALVAGAGLAGYGTGRLIGKNVKWGGKSVDERMEGMYGNTFFDKKKQEEEGADLDKKRFELRKQNEARRAGLVPKKDNVTNFKENLPETTNTNGTPDTPGYYKSTKKTIPFGSVEPKDDSTDKLGGIKKLNKQDKIDEQNAFLERMSNSGPMSKDEMEKIKFYHKPKVEKERIEPTEVITKKAEKASEKLGQSKELLSAKKEETKPVPQVPPTIIVNPAPVQTIVASPMIYPFTPAMYFNHG